MRALLLAVMLALAGCTADNGAFAGAPDPQAPQLPAADAGRRSPLDLAPCDGGADGAELPDLTPAPPDFEPAPDQAARDPACTITGGRPVFRMCNAQHPLCGTCGDIGPTPCTFAGGDPKRCVADCASCGG